MKIKEAIEELKVQYLGDSERLREAKDLVIKKLEKKDTEAEWLMPDKAYNVEVYRKCSNCKVHFKCYEKYNPSASSLYAGETFYFTLKMHYCPNCGRKMGKLKDQKA